MSSDPDLTNPQRGHLYVIAAPSGTGKTTLVHRLLQNEAMLGFTTS